MKTFKRHFWYLGGTDLVGLALFSDKVTILEKIKMVEKLAIDKDLDKNKCRYYRTPRPFYGHFE